MRIQVTGEANPDAIDVVGGQPFKVIEVDTVISTGGGGDVTSVNGQAGDVDLDAGDVGADPAGSAASAVGGHVAASDPHGDRAYADAGKLAKAANLADLADAAAARTSLGLGTAATRDTGSGAGTVAAGDDSRLTGAAQKASNLSDLASTVTARSNLGLGGAAVLNVGTITGTVAAGDDSRLTNSRTPTAHAATHAAAGSDPVTPDMIGALTQAVADLRYLLLTGGTLTGTVTNNVSSATATAFGGGVAGDTFDRWRLLANGSQQLGPGNAARDTTWGRQGAAQVGTSDSDILVGLAGKGFRVKEGSNAKMGTATLATGTVTVANTSVTSSSRIFLTCQTPGGTPGFLRVSARTAGTSFTILSSSSSDTSVVGWLILEPA